MTSYAHLLSEEDSKKYATVRGKFFVKCHNVTLRGQSLACTDNKTGSQLMQGYRKHSSQSGHSLTNILDENRRGQCEWEWFTYNGCGFTVLCIKSTYAILLQLHAKESSEIYCHTCLLLFKEKKA